ncbi:hypothetical protein [Chromobacterium subtsugae]|uniref:hypothetical protein n=1 Tax=Chromobacterium subtsugae TaxID=251747 RepID=UPI000ACDA771|nr:hypothetical protein [Chromobacterium subtsugae]
MQCQYPSNAITLLENEFTLKTNPDLSITSASAYLSKVENDYGKNRISSLAKKIQRNSDENPYIILLNGVVSSRQQVSSDIAQLLIENKSTRLQEMLRILSNSSTRTPEKSVSLLLTMITNGWLLVFNAQQQLSTFDFLYIVFKNFELAGRGYDEFHQRFIEKAAKKGNDFRLIMERLYFGKSSRGMRSAKVSNAVKEFSKEIKNELSSLGIMEVYRSRKDWIVWRKVGTEKRWDISEKVYISTSSSKINKQILRVIFDTFANSPATSIKMIMNERVANRCDAIVIYCDSKNFDGDATVVANLISQKTNKLQLKGRRVPFSRSFNDSELISFGVDFRWLKLSWRQFVCTIIAKALMLNKIESNKKVFHQGLNIYMGLAGIRSDNWEASQSIREELIKHATDYLVNYSILDNRK